MALVPLDSSNQVSLYSNNSNNTFGSISNPMVESFAPRSEYPIDPRNDLLPPGFTSPFIDMKFGPPEQTVKRYFSFTIDDIDSFHKEKIKKWIKVYEKVLGHCFRKVREHVLRDQKFCFFPIPEYLTGFPLYNITHCACFIIKKLNQSKFKTKYIPPNVIYIHWNVENHYDRVSNHINPNNSNNPEQQLLTQSKQSKQSNNSNQNIHYITLESEPEQKYIQPSSQTNMSNNNKYAFQKQDQFLF